MNSYSPELRSDILKPVELPVGYANTRFIFQCAGVLDEMSFAIGSQVGIGQDPSDIADLQRTTWGTQFVPTAGAFLDDWTFVGCSTTVMTSGGPIIGESLAPVVGTSSANGQSCNTAVLVKKNTALGGRKGRGRIFVPPFDLEEEIVSTAGFITPAEVTTYQDQWAAYLDAAVTADIAPVLFHSDIEDVPTEITSFTVSALCATQRRRMR